MTKGAPQFNELIHAPNRLRICAVLNSLESAEFGVLREATGLSDSALSKQLLVLEEAGYLQPTKRKRDGRSRTWATLTKEGRNAYRSHVAALKLLVGAER